MEQTELKRILEAVIFASGQPMTLKRVAEAFQGIETSTIRQLISELNAEYQAAQRAFTIQEVAGGYQFVTDQHLASWIRKALQPPKPDAVSQAAMETLAIIAYRQPLTKAEVELVRGVDVTASLDTLQERRFVRIIGRKDSPGRPFLYGTTAEFLRHFGLKSLDELPKVDIPTLKEPEDVPATPPIQPPASAPEPSVPASTH